MKRMYAVLVVLMLCLGAGAGLAADLDEFAEAYEWLAEDFSFFDQDFDLGGRTVSFLGWVDPIPGLANSGVLEDAEERFNVKLDFRLVQWDQAIDTYMSRLMAGDSATDIWQMDHHFWPLAGNNGLYPVDTFLPDEFFEEGLDVERSAVSAVLSHGGKRYIFDHFSNGIWQYQFVWWNRSLFEREGLPDLHELYLNDEWTWDVFLDIARQATADTTGDGEIDQWGWGFPGGQDAWIFSNGGRFTRMDEDGRVVFALGDPEALEALAFHRQVAEANVSIADDGFQSFLAGNVAMNLGQRWRMGPMDDEYGAVPMPKGPSAERYTFNTGHFVLALPVNSVDAPAMVALLSYLFPRHLFEEQTDDVIRGIVQDPVSAQVMYSARETWEHEWHMFSGILGHVWDASQPVGQMFEEVAAGESTPTVAAARVAGEAQARLDQLFGQ